MRTIWKTSIPIRDSVTVYLPKGVRALSCHANDDPAGVIDVWWEVETDNEHVDTPLTIAGTGHPLDDRLDNVRFVGTTFHGPLVFHVYAPGV